MKDSQLSEQEPKESFEGQNKFLGGIGWFRLEHAQLGNTW